MVPDFARNRWDGAAWRWWAFAAGVALVGLTLALGALAAALLDGDRASLTLLAFTIELFALGVSGSGMTEGLAGRAIAGGMARQPQAERRGPIRASSAAEQARRDRRTIRAGLVALPILVAFLATLFG